MRLPAHLLEDTWGKATCRAVERKRLGLFCSLETGLCNRSENGPQVTTHLSESERSLRADGDAGSVREVRARGRLQGRGTLGGFLEEAAFLSYLPNRLIYLSATDFFHAPLALAHDSTEPQCFMQSDLVTGTWVLLSHSPAFHPCLSHNSSLTLGEQPNLSPQIPTYETGMKVPTCKMDTVRNKWHNILV